MNNVTLQTNVSLREIEDSDLEKIMNWRMDKDITKYMNTNPKLTLVGQKKWLDAIRINTDVQYWMIVIDGQDAGVINITGLKDPQGNLGWAYYIGEKKLRDIKIALSLEMSLYDYIFDKLHKKALYGDVFTLNKGVIQLHLMCGSEIVEEKKAHVLKEGVYYDVTFMRMTAERWNEIRDTKKYQKISFK